MTSLSHEPPRVVSERPRWSRELIVPEMWACLAIITMWLAVLFDAIFGPDIVNTSGASSSSVPSAIVVAAFAFLGTWVLANRAFRRHEGD